MNKCRILVMGLPGSGKTTFASELKSVMPDYLWLNADAIRSQHNDWDFSYKGRIRQATRMRHLSESADAIIDMVCPLPEMRDIIGADTVVWMDTITAGRYEDTNSVFVPPEIYNYRISAWDDPTWNKALQQLSS